MKLIYWKRRKPTISSDYVFVQGNHRVHLKFNEAKDVDDRVAFAILDRDSDIIKIADGAVVRRPGRPKKDEVVEKMDAPAEDKQVKAYQNKDF